MGMVSEALLPSLTIPNRLHGAVHSWRDG